MRIFLSTVLMGFFLLSEIPCRAEVRSNGFGGIWPIGINNRTKNKSNRGNTTTTKGTNKGGNSNTTSNGGSGGTSVKALRNICNAVHPLRNALLKNVLPGHISPTDNRAPGFALICGSDCTSAWPVNAYYSDGGRAFSLDKYGIWDGNGKPRAYCAVGRAPQCSVSSVVRESKRKGRDGRVYLHFGGKSCRAAIPGQRNGSTS